MILKNDILENYNLFSKIVNSKIYSFNNLSIFPFIKLKNNYFIYYIQMLNNKPIFINENKYDFKKLNGKQIINIFSKYYKCFKKETYSSFFINIYFEGLNLIQEYTIIKFLDNFDNILENKKIDKIQLLNKNVKNKIRNVIFKQNKSEIKFLKDIQKNDLKRRKLVFFKKEFINKNIYFLYLNFIYLMSKFLDLNTDIKQTNLVFSLYFDKENNDLYIINYYIKNEKSNIKFYKISKIINNVYDSILLLFNNFFIFIKKKYKFNYKSLNFVIDPKTYLFLTKKEKIILIKKNWSENIISKLQRHLNIDHIKLDDLFPLLENILITKEKLIKTEKNINNFFFKKKEKISNNILKYNEINANKILKKKVKLIKSDNLKIIKTKSTFRLSKFYSSDKSNPEFKKWITNQFINIKYKKFNSNDIKNDWANYKYLKRNIFSRGEIFNKNSYKSFSVPFLIVNKNF